MIAPSTRLCSARRRRGRVMIPKLPLSEAWSRRLRSAAGSIIASSDDAIISKDLDGRISSWNAGATRIFGYTSNEMIGQPIARIIPPELHAEESEIFLRLQRGERIDHFETVRVAKDGRRIDMSITVSPMLDKFRTIFNISNVNLPQGRRLRHSVFLPGVSLIIAIHQLARLAPPSGATGRPSSMFQTFRG
jgi:PAS domain S-box-containing protein